MKHLCAMIFFLFSYLLLCTHAAYAVDWRHYGKDMDGNFLYYDKDSMAEIKGVVYVWEKKVYASNNLFRIRQILGERYAKVIEKITLYEFHCPTRQVQSRVSAYYDTSGALIDYYYDDLKREWRKIVSGTDMVLLYRICCEKKEGAK